MSSCLFCRIIHKEIPARIIFENESMLAILDAFPSNPGHFLVIPKQHVATIMEADEALLAEWISTTKRLAQMVQEAIGAAGINILQNNGEAAGQVIPHLHMHVIPRFANDGLKHWASKPLDEQEGDRLLQQIRTRLDSSL